MVMVSYKDVDVVEESITGKSDGVFMLESGEDVVVEEEEMNNSADREGEDKLSGLG